MDKRNFITLSLCTSEAEAMPTRKYYQVKSLCVQTGADNEGREGEGKEREAPTHFIENSKLFHAARITQKKRGWDQLRGMLVVVIYCQMSKIALFAHEEIVASSSSIFLQNLFASGPGDLHGVCPLISGTNVPLAHRVILDSFDTCRIISN